jgi:hypothetical protein
MSRPSLVVVSALAHEPLIPRGDRTREIVAALRDDWSVELVAKPTDGLDSSRSPQVGRTLVRRALNYAHSSLLLDKFEPWSLRRFGSWRPRADGAVLIGYPFSPLVYAARRLAASEIPYLVDVGDPWVLTADRPIVSNVARLRASRAETRLWAGASGAVVTTENQAARLHARFPSLPILVRPNGYPDPGPGRAGALPQTGRRPAGSVLRIAHFGNISWARLDVSALLTSLGQSGTWERVELHVFGSDWTETVAQGRAYSAFFHESRPWLDVVNDSRLFDLAMVIGNRDASQLPSKAVAYLQLPIPRLAVVADPGTDALAHYLADKKGWIVLQADADDAVARIEEHVSRAWPPEELSPPPEESWRQVSRTIAGFVRDVLGPRAAAPPA